MSGKGKSKSNSGTASSQNTNSGSNNNNGYERQNATQPDIVTGWEYHTYSRGSSGDRYVYIGKDEDTGEPEFLDYGPKK